MPTGILVFRSRNRGRKRKRESDDDADSSFDEGNVMEKTNVQVVIGGRILTMSGFENEVYMQKIAAYINRKYRELDEGGYSEKITRDLKPVLVEINLADELLKEREKVRLLTEKLAESEEAIELLRQDNAALTVRLEAQEYQNGKEV